MLAPVLALAMLTPEQSFTRGSDLYRQCKNWVALMEQTRRLDDGESYEAGECYGYIDGLAAGLATMQITCPRNATMGTMIRVYLVYMDKHPKVLDYAASAGVYGALQEAYPCPAKK